MTMAKGDAVCARELAVGYDGRALIHGIGFEVRRGEIVALIGPNGSGKSTLLKTLARQLAAVAGTVWICGGELRALSGRALATRMAVLLTDRPRPELMTCRDVVAMGRYPYTGRMGTLAREDEEKVEAALQAVHAADLAGRDFNAISDGQRQRVMLARAICQEPEVIVLDEPTSFLDIRHKLELLGILRRMAREQGIAVVMSLHEIDLAQKVADRVMCVKGETPGRFGPPAEVFDEAAVRELYGIDRGFYDARFGSVELPRPEGEPQVFVLSSCGTGIPVYRALQKAGVPFAAGVLYANDVDYQLARLLASEVIVAEPFEPVGGALIRRALDCMRTCGRAIDAGVKLGSCNAALRALVEEAGRMPAFEL